MGDGKKVCPGRMSETGVGRGRKLILGRDIG